MPNILPMMMGAAGVSSGGGPGTLWGWGSKGSIIGDDDTTAQSSPIQSGSEENWLAVDPDDIRLKKLVSSSCAGAIRDDGTLWTWGQGNYGKTGHGNTTDTSSPVQVGSLTDWSNLSLGTDGMCAVKTDGTMWCWGRNWQGALGQGDTTDRSSPVQVGALTNWKASYCTGGAFFGVKTDGTLWAWGKGAYGQMALGDTGNKCSPTQVGSLTDWAQLDGGDEYTGFVKTDGTLWAVGRNAVGVLGVGNTTDYSSPVQVGSLTDWFEVYATVGTNGGSGNERGTMAATKTDGTMWGWGTQTEGGKLTGQIGVGNTTTYSSPVQVGSLTDWRTVWTSQYVVMADKTDGSLWAWGDGSDGLGNGNTTSVSSPVQVGAYTDIQGICGGAGVDKTYLFVRTV